MFASATMDPRIALGDDGKKYNMYCGQVPLSSSFRKGFENHIYTLDASEKNIFGCVVCKKSPNFSLFFMVGATVRSWSQIWRYSKFL